MVVATRRTIQATPATTAALLPPMSLILRIEELLEADLGTLTSKGKEGKSGRETKGKKQSRCCI